MRKEGEDIDGEEGGWLRTAGVAARHCLAAVIVFLHRSSPLLYLSAGYFSFLPFFHCVSLASLPCFLSLCLCGDPLRYFTSFFLSFFPPSLSVHLIYFSPSLNFAHDLCLSDKSCVSAIV